ncbi:branched-chain-amino-acid aminotransferase-like protein 2, partial [Lingula anatina]|uniref:Branched-chain-amino-acid aminotransferase-like protein 2 n=1 Tax=Lingula anatina TaxID=7574 RepID=A0A2R2MNN9_LINAN
TNKSLGPLSERGKITVKYRLRFLASGAYSLKCIFHITGAELVFGKEMAVYLVDRLQSLDYIPRGYQHTFLIRSPAKSVPSLYNCLTDERNATKEFDTLEASYKPLHQLFHLILEESGSVPVLIDADDLLQNPDAIIRQYCRRTGLTFHKEMLEWDSGAVPDKTHWHRWPGWYDTLLKSSGFKKQEEIGHTMVKELPQDIQKCIETNMPYYEHLLKFRLMPEVNDV